MTNKGVLRKISICQVKNRSTIDSAEKTDDAINKVNQRPGVRPAREHISNKVFTLPVITICKMVTYMRLESRTVNFYFPVNVGFLFSKNAFMPSF